MSEDLEPFSFTKKPIDTFIPIHSTISEIIPTNTDAKSRCYEDASPHDTRNPILNDVDYDEQIRAPRFNLKDPPIDPNPHQFSVDNLFVDKAKHPDSHTKDKNVEKLGPEETKYTPANFDLNRNYTYSYSSVELVDNNSTQNLTEHFNNTNFSTNPPNNFTDAINNLNENITTEERSNSNATMGTTSTASSSSTTTSSNLHNSKFIKPVYNFKRPLSIPAVLRPMTDSSSLTGSQTRSNRSSQVPSSEASINSSPNLGFKIDLAQAQEFFNSDPELRNSSTVTSPSFDPSVMSSDELLKYFEPIEPTHDHWKPNHFTNCCMKCFNNFGNFFNRKRRHHCRFCGFIICSSCLFNDNINEIIRLTRTRAQKQAQLQEPNQSSTWFPTTSKEEDNFNFNLIYLDSNARFVIPIFKKFYSLDLPIKSLNKFFKLNKVCKNCGDNYLNLLINLNTPTGPGSTGADSAPVAGKVNIDTLNLPFVFIENPFLTSKASNEAPNYERRNSIINSNDWNWSSF